jgi:hypothetical protein
VPHFLVKNSPRTLEWRGIKENAAVSRLHVIFTHFIVDKLKGIEKLFCIIYASSSVYKVGACF